MPQFWNFKEYLILRGKGFAKLTLKAGGISSIFLPSELI